MYFCINDFEVGVNDSIFFGNEQQKVYMRVTLSSTLSRIPPKRHARFSQLRLERFYHPLLNHSLILIED